MKRRIDEIHTDLPFYGSRKIQVLLQPEFGTVARNTIRRYMHEMAIITVYPGPNLSRRHQEHRVYPYLLRGVTAQKPNNMWGIDITYIRLQHGWLYLVVILDWYARSIVRWALDDCLAMPFVLDAVDQALQTATPQMWKSDQGSHFTNPAYIQRLGAAGAQISMDGKGRALDNIFTERFWRSLTYEEVYLHDYATPREARQGIQRSMTLYNGQRPHQMPCKSDTSSDRLTSPHSRSNVVQYTCGGHHDLPTVLSWGVPENLVL